MARVTTLGTIVLALLFALLAVSVPARGQVLCRSEADDVAALRSFNAAVTDYVELHRRLDARLSPQNICSDPEQIANAAEELAERIRTERAYAARGDIFTPEVADLFRVRLAASSTARADDELPADLEGEDTACAPLPEVNTGFRWEGTSGIGELARMLPTLPLELEYRLVGRALVLVDVPANLVVDVLDHAVR